MTDDVVVHLTSSRGPPGPLQAAFAALPHDDFFRSVLDRLPAAVYTTDVTGRITYYNEAAVALWGQRPKLNSSEWCGSWKLFWPDGRRMRHEDCPMAVAVKEQRAIRGGRGDRRASGRQPRSLYSLPDADLQFGRRICRRR